MSYRNRFQSNSRIDPEGGYIAWQIFNFPNLKHYIENQAWDFLRSFDLTPRSIRKNLLNHYESRRNYLSPVTMNLIQDNIALLEFRFKYTVSYQPNMNINDS